MAALGGPGWGAIDFVGAPATAALGFDALAKGGKLVMVGLFGGAAPWSLPLVPMKAASIVGSYTGSLGESASCSNSPRRRVRRHSRSLGGRSARRPRRSKI